MTTPAAPQVDCEQQHPSLAAPDIPAAAEFYAKKLGFFVAFTWGEPPTMAGVNLGQVQIFLEQGTPSPAGCSVYFGVGSPHTKRTLRYIQELKKKHGIDYDSHASYRFVEE